MLSHETLLEIRRTLVSLYPTTLEIRDWLELSGVQKHGLELSGSPDLCWKRALNECLLQGQDALESLLVEVLEKNPGRTTIEVALKELARGGAHVPEARTGGGSITEAIIRDPLEGTELLIAFAEARGLEGAHLLQLKRCYSVLEDIVRVRKKYGRMLKHETRWKQAVHEILEVASQLERTSEKAHLG